ncbi:MAG: DNA methylase, partial [Thaumarchaeota archaeon]|nr:DNA methylase [Nitrososphaerota archaeon]
ILWLNEQLKTPQTYQDIQPKFLQEIHQKKFEKLPELSEILEQNFLEDGDGKWYIPDPTKLKDLEKIREKDLLKEFQTYVESKGKLKQFRLESIRAGFKKKWSENDYKSIVDIAQRLPEQIIQEDSSLLMYYDNALSRL